MIYQNLCNICKILQDLIASLKWLVLCSSTSFYNWKYINQFANVTFLTIQYSIFSFHQSANRRGWTKEIFELSSLFMPKLAESNLSNCSYTLAALSAVNNKTISSQLVCSCHQLIPPGYRNIADNEEPDRLACQRSGSFIWQQASHSQVCFEG